MSRRERLRECLMSRVVVDPETGCWIWQGRTSGTPGRGRPGRGHSYPRVDFDGGTMAAHRAMWILEHGPIPPRKQLDHECRTRLCIRPDPGHNVMKTHLQNQRLRAAAAREMRCDDPTTQARADGPSHDSVRGDRAASDSRPGLAPPDLQGGQSGQVPTHVLSDR